MTNNTTFHASLYGSFGGGLRPDRDGYVHTTRDAVHAGEWGESLTDEEADEIAAHNVGAVADSERELAAWRAGNA